MKKIIFSLLLLGLFLASLSFVSAGTCENYSYGDLEVFGGVISYCDLDTGDFVPQKINDSVCMNDFECQSGFCISDSCLDSSDFLRNMYQLSLPSANCTPNLTSAGCINMTYYVGLINGINISAPCDFEGYSCYVCNSGYIWNSTLRNCQQIPVAPAPGVSGSSSTGGTASTGGGSGSCITTWVCDDWEPCSGGTQIRNCKKAISYCYASLKRMPALNQTCTEETVTTEYITPSEDPLRALKTGIVILIGVLILAILIWYIIWEFKKKKTEKLLKPLPELSPKIQASEPLPAEDLSPSFTRVEEPQSVFPDAEKKSARKKSKKTRSSSKKRL